MLNLRIWQDSAQAQCITLPSSVSPQRCGFVGRHLPGWTCKTGKCRQLVVSGSQKEAPDWEAERLVLRKRTLKPNQLETLRKFEEEVAIGTVCKAGAFANGIPQAELFGQAACCRLDAKLERKFFSVCHYSPGRCCILRTVSSWSRA